MDFLRSGGKYLGHGREAEVAAHYNVDDLGQKILDAARESGLDLDALTPVDLAPVDEFHMGGRAATEHIVGLMALPAGTHVLDVGSGLGGLVRYLAAEMGCRATGIDLTPEYVQVARMLTERTGLAANADFRIGSALALPWPEASFDAAVTFHVAMNITDRPRLYQEVARVTRPGGVFANYDVMRGPNPGMEFPVPWAETSDTVNVGGKASHDVGVKTSQSRMI
jgi:MPBQ/MSBQ methyltransferase